MINFTLVKGSGEKRRFFFADKVTEKKKTFSNLPSPAARRVCAMLVIKSPLKLKKRVSLAYRYISRTEVGKEIPPYQRLYRPILLTD